jgi:NAD(P)H-nitrite reductase large subunit
MAIGVRPNLDVIKGTGIEAKQGIIVDNKMQTNIAGIYAAGDVVQADDMLSGEKRVNAIWPLAYKQGRIAGANMAGGNKSYEGGFAQNSLTVLGLSTISMGIVDPPSKNGYEVITGKGKGKYSYKKFVFDKDTIIGGIFIDDIDRSGIITGLVKERYKVKDNKERFLSEKFGLINLDRSWRDAKLTKPV